MVVVGGESINIDWQIHQTAGSIDWHSAVTVDTPIVANDSIKIIQGLLS